MGVKKHKIKKALFQWVIEHHTVAIVIHSGDPLNSFKLHKIAYVSWGGGGSVFDIPIYSLNFFTWLHKLHIINLQYNRQTWSYRGTGVLNY